MSMQPFCFEEHQVRVVLLDGEPWFVAKDVCQVLELDNPGSSLTLLDGNEKGVHTVDTPGGRQKATIISESGLYSLIFRSRKSEARRFQRWVTQEVLPDIRMMGRYGLDGEPVPEPLEQPPLALPGAPPKLPRSLRHMAMHTALQLLKATGGGEGELDRLYLKYCELLAAGQDSATGSALLRGMQTPAGVVTAFLEERCLLGPDQIERNDELYAAFGRFCAEAGRPRLGRELFFKELYALSGCQQSRPREKGRRPRCVRGVGLLG